MNDIRDDTGACDRAFMRTVALAMQGMAVWHLLLGIAALIFVALILSLTGPVETSSTSEHYSLIGAELTGGALAAALIFGGVSWAILGKQFLRPRWSVILLPGLIGALASGFFDLIGWPVSVLIGGIIAYWLVRIRLDPTPAPQAE